MKKQEILSSLEQSRSSFLQAVEGLSDQDLAAPGVNADWSIQDILFHLTMWEAELVKLLWQAAQGEKPTTVHFSETSVDDINLAWLAQGRMRTLDSLWEDFHAVRKQTMRRVNELQEKDLEDPARYAWLDEIPLSTWIAQDTFEHEPQHIEQIRIWRSQKGV